MLMVFVLISSSRDENCFLHSL